MSKTLTDDCFRPDRPRLLHGEAVALLKSRVRAIAGVETVALGDAAGRVLAGPVIAQHPVPAHTNAAVDGYAFGFSSYDRAAGTTFEIQGRAAAGHPVVERCRPGEAVRIFTGAVVPEGADTVVMQEDVTLAGQGRVQVGPGLKKGANVRKAGEDVAAGTELFTAGAVLRPQDLAALASVGQAAVSCRARLRVGVVSSGDEVVQAGARALAPGEVFDANTPMLASLARLAGADVTTLGIWPDRPGEVRARLQDAAARFDVILTSGGASMGEEDHMAGALEQLGTRHLWQLAVKPGRPMMFGQIASGAGAEARDTVMVGLPGNPVAVFVCFLMYVFPLLRALSGAPWPEPRRFKLPAAFDFAGRKTGRREFWRGMLVDAPQGLAVDKFQRDGSGLISGLRAADGLIDIPEDAGDVQPGDLIDFIPFGEFGILQS